MRLAGQAQHRRSRLNSNVRPQNPQHFAISTRNMGCIAELAILASLAFLARYIPMGYILLAVFGLWLLTRYLNRDKIRAERLLEEAQTRARRVAHRDADSQTTPYDYQCVGHPNRTLALRYGIANLQRDPDNHRRMVPNDRIRLRKVKRLLNDHHLAELPDFGNREVRVVIEHGTEIVKTFYPLHEDWFGKHRDLELVLKENKTFTLKDLAMLHVQKTVKSV